jgi:hypothetical protein
MRYFSLILLFLVGLSTLKAQHTPTGYESVDKVFTNLGYSVAKSFVYNIETTQKTVPVQCFGGNRYFFTAQPFDNKAKDISISLKDAKGKIYAEGRDQLDIDLRFQHGKLELILTISTQDVASKPQVLLVQAYRSVSNDGTNHLNNKDENAFYTLEGVTLINTYKSEYEQKIKEYLSTEMQKQGATPSKLIVADLTKKAKIIPYTFYRENQYAIYAYSPSIDIVAFELIKPKEVKANPFSGDSITKPESLIQKSSQGMLAANFVGQSPNLFELGVRTTGLPMQYGGFVVYAIGYRSKDNQTQDATLNKDEKFYVR